MSDPTDQDVYTRLAYRWTGAVWGWADHVPDSGVLQQMLKETFSEEEAQALCDIPLRQVPLEMVSLDEISANSAFARDQIERILDGLVAQSRLFFKQTGDGRKAYATYKSGFGYPQLYYCTGGQNPLAQKVLPLELNPENVKARVELMTTTATRPYRYVPTSEAIDPQWQNVYPSESIEKVLQKATKIALIQCSCRVKHQLSTGEGCGHSNDVCLKLNELAEGFIDNGLAQELTLEEALAVIRKADEEGLVHFADNTGEDIKHICNCCGDACWNVGPIRRRQVPRDVVMATYFLRETNQDQCTACEECVDICPVQAVTIQDGVAKVDLDWCIGCGVCVPRCSTGAIKLVEKDKMPIGAANFADLHIRINNERAGLLQAKGRQA